mgnify:CR=1 FL=1
MDNVNAQQEHKIQEVHVLHVLLIKKSSQENAFVLQKPLTPEKPVLHAKPPKLLKMNNVFAHQQHSVMTVQNVLNQKSGYPMNVNAPLELNHQEMTVLNVLHTRQSLAENVLVNQMKLTLVNHAKHAPRTKLSLETNVFAQKEPFYHKENALHQFHAPRTPSQLQTVFAQKDKPCQKSPDAAVLKDIIQVHQEQSVW